MARPLRYFPPQTLVEVTVRTIHGRLLLRPSPRLNELVLGVLARAQQRFAMPIIAVTVLGNHVHWLCQPNDAVHLARFQQYALSNLAREVGRLHGWREKFWSRRYRAIPVSDEPEAQVERLTYLLSNGVKERLVDHPRDWPGVHSVDALLDGKLLTGVWVDRSLRYRAERKSLQIAPGADESRYALTLSPLPSWAHLAEPERRRRVAEIVEQIVALGRAERRGRAVLGPARIVRLAPHQRPSSTDQSPAPLVHAASKTARLAMKAAYHAFLVAFRLAADQLRSGVRDAIFPQGCFPPALPAVALWSG
jgi:REP element-mobilizing transposase RayT